MSNHSVTGDFESTFTITVHDMDALHAYMARYPESWPDERTILKALIWQSHFYRQQSDPAGTDGFADLPEGIVSVSWDDPYELMIFHDGEWWS